MATLSVARLRKRFAHVEVLKGIDLEAAHGEFVALVGPSGCGKSTLLAMIAGLETVTEGEIHIDGRLVNAVAPKDRDIAMVFQSYALYPTMTARQNMTFGMESRGVPKAAQDEAIKRVAGLLQIEALLNRKPGQLSGGQRQRVAMGRALVRDPKLFLFDEPLSNLDAKLRVDMRTEIKKLHARVGKTTVYVTHDQIEAMTLATRIAVMHHGQLQQFDEPHVVYGRPANMFVAGFMGSPSMNFIPATLTETDGTLAVEVAIFGGGMARLPLPYKPARAPADNRVVLGVRPEHMFRFAEDLKSRKPALAAFEAPIDVVEPTGAETIAVLKLGERDVTGRFDPDGAPRLGENMKVGVDMAQCLSVRSRRRNLDTESRRVTFANYPSLVDRVVFVTGGATGIGADIVEAFARQRARVALVDVQARGRGGVGGAHCGARRTAAARASGRRHRHSRRCRPRLRGREKSSGRLAFSSTTPPTISDTRSTRCRSSSGTIRRTSIYATISSPPRRFARRCVNSAAAQSSTCLRPHGASARRKWRPTPRRRRRCSA